MIDHISVAVRDLDASVRFYQAVLGAIGYQKLDRSPAHRRLRQKLSGILDQSARRPPPIDADSGAHAALRVRTSELVDAFHAAALAAGGRCDGAPGLRPQHGEGYYAAFIRDPDGNRVEAVTFLKPQE